MNIFLSAPFTQLLTDSAGPPTAFVTIWDELFDTLQGAGHEVFSAHKREAWGAQLNTPAEALAADLQGLRTADLVLAYVGSPASPGVQLEIGFSLALQRRLVIFVDRGQREPYLLRGVPAVADAELVEIDQLAEIVSYARNAAFGAPRVDTSRTTGGL